MTEQTISEDLESQIIEAQDRSYNAEEFNQNETEIWNEDGIHIQMTDEESTD